MKNKNVANALTRIRTGLAIFRSRYRLIATLVLLNAPLIAVIIGLNLRRVDGSLLTWGYAASVILGYYVLPALVVLSVLFMVLAPLRRTLVTVSAVLMTLYVYYLLLNSIFYDIYKIHIDFFWLEFLVQDFSGLGVSASIVMTALAALVVVIIVEAGLLVLAHRVRNARGLMLWPAVAIVALALSQGVHIIAYENNDSRITGLTEHFPYYLPATSHRNARKYKDLLPLNELQVAESGNERASMLNYPLSAIHCESDGNKKAPNILFILLESWRSDTMNEEVSPNIAALAARSSVFLNHFSSGNSTVAGLFGMFYGIHPTYWASVKANNAEIDNPLLIDLLKENHYTFGIYAESNFQRHKIKDTVFRGIDVHNLFAGRTAVEKDRDMTEQVISFLREQRENENPFMALAFYKSSHFNYSYDKEFAKFLPARKMNVALVGTARDPELYLNDYRNAIYFEDHLVGTIIDELETLKMLDNTIIVITTDHAEEFDDNGENYWGHGSNFTQYQTRVPLVVYLPDTPAREVTAMTSHIDIPPTIIQNYLGCTNDIADYSDGMNLMGPLPAERALVIASYFNHAFVIGDDVFAIYPLFTRKYKLHDITKDASRPSIDILKELMSDTKRFLRPGTAG